MLSLNPYIAGNPVGGTPNFVGRADVLREVLRVMRQPHQNIIVLYGQRRIGKTSVLQQLAARLPTEGTYYPVYFDLQDKASWPLSRVLTDLARALSHELVRQGPPELRGTGPLLSDEEPVRAFQQTWLPALLQRLPPGHSIVLLFDEFDVLADPKGGQAGTDLFPYLRGLLATDPARLQFAFVIGRKVEDLESIALSLFKGAPALRVSLLNKADTFELIRLSERNATLHWADEALEKVWDLTHGHPFLTQQLCSRLWENLYDSDPTGTPSVLREDVENAIAETLESSRNTLEWLWDGLPPAERVVISALAGAGSRAITQPQLEQLLRESGVRVVIRELQNAPQLLQDWDLIEPAEGGYRFRVELFRQWILEHKPLTRVQEELDRIEPLAENLYQAAYGFFRSNQLEDALPLLRQAIGLNPNHARSRQLLAEIFLLRGEVDQAVQILQMLYDTQPAVARPRLVQALLLKAEEEPDEEKRQPIYQQILLVDANHPIALQRVSEIQRTLRQRDLAQRMEQLEKAEKDKRYRDALDLAHKLAEKYPDERAWDLDLDRLEQKTKLAEAYQRAIGAWNSGNRDAALRGLAEVIALEPDYEEATRYLHLAKTGHDPALMMNQLAGEQKAHHRAKARLEEETDARAEAEKQRNELQIRLESEKYLTESTKRMSRRMLYWSIGSSFLALAFLIAWLLSTAINNSKLVATQTEMAETYQEVAQLQTLVSAQMSATPANATGAATETPTNAETRLPSETPLPADVTPDVSPTPTASPTSEPTARPTLDPFAGLVTADTAARLRLGKGQLFAAALSPDKTLLAVGASTGVYLYNADTFTPLWSRATASPVLALDISTGGVLAAGLADGTVYIYDLQTGDEKQALDDHAVPVESVAFSPDGNWLATGDQEGRIMVWDTLDWTPYTLDAHADGVKALAFSPENTTLASGADDNTVIIWNLADPEKPTHQEPYTTSAGVRSLAWSANNVLAWGLADGRMEILDLETFEISPLPGHAAAVTGVSWADGRLVSVAEDGGVILWNLVTKAATQTLTETHFPLLHVMWKTDETLLTVTGAGVKQWDLAAEQVTETLLGFTRPVNSVAFSPVDGTLLASGSDDGQVYLWNTETGGQIRLYSGLTYTVTSVVFSPDGLTLAGASWDNTIRLWEVETGAPIGIITQTAPILSLAFSPVDNNLLAFGTKDHNVIIWDIAAGAPKFPALSGHNSSINALDYSFDGRFLASGSDGGVIILWDTGSGRILHTLGDNEPGHTAKIFDVKFTSPSTFLGSASADRAIIVWNFEGEEQSGKSLQDEIVWCLAFSENGWLASGMVEGTIVLWQLADFPNNPQVDLTAHNAGVTSLAFSPDSHLLASGSRDGTIVLWDMTLVSP